MIAHATKHIINSSSICYLKEIKWKFYVFITRSKQVSIWRWKVQNKFDSNIFFLTQFIKSLSKITVREQKWNQFIICKVWSCQHLFSLHLFIVTRWTVWRRIIIVTGGHIVCFIVCFSGIHVTWSGCWRPKQLKHHKNELQFFNGTQFVVCFFFCSILISFEIYTNANKNSKEIALIVISLTLFINSNWKIYIKVNVSSPPPIYFNQLTNIILTF